MLPLLLAAKLNHSPFNVLPFFLLFPYDCDMKFEKLEPFEGHWRGSYPNHLSALFFLCCQKEEELKKISSSLVDFLKKGSDFRLAETVGQAITHVGSPSFLSERVSALLYLPTDSPKSDLELLQAYAQKPNPKGHLLVASTSSSELASLYAKGKKEIVFLDLTKEKPWEEKERIAQWCRKEFAKEGIGIDPDALEALFARSPQDRLSLSQEMEKLFCFVYPKKRVSLEDVISLSGAPLGQTPYQIAQALLWKKGGAVSIDPSFALPLVGVLRNQLEMGLTLSVSGEGAAERFPKLRPKALEETLLLSRTFGSSFFIRGLQELFRFEVGLKSSSVSPELLWNRFVATLGVGI